MRPKDGTYDKSIAHILRLIIRKYRIVLSCRLYCITPTLSVLDLHSDTVSDREVLHDFYGQVTTKCSNRKIHLNA
jgi:hypothetical protein